MNKGTSNNPIAYYSLGLTGYEIHGIHHDGNETYVTWLYVGSRREHRTHRARVYTTSDGRAYFKVTSGRKIYFDECSNMYGLPFSQ